MIWTYIGVGLTIFFGGVGVGVPIGIWIGNMMSAQRHLRRDVDELRNQVKEIATLQKSVSDQQVARPVRIQTVNLRDLLSQQPADNDQST